MPAHIKSGEFIGGKGPRSLKNWIKGKVSIWTFTIIIYLRLDVFIDSTKVNNTQHM